MSKNSLVSVIVVLALVVLAFATNPSPERHRARIRDAVAERRPIAGALGLGSLRAFGASYHSLGVASYTTDGERTVSFGLFGMVFVRE
ncbi:MAG TPA: hypothetical protein VF291_04155 [Burkholderiaceae bacterium]|jgi:hypothetical protein